MGSEIKVAKRPTFKLVDMQDDYRSPEAYTNGGFALTDQVVIGKFRSAFKGLI